MMLKKKFVQQATMLNSVFIGSVKDIMIISINWTMCILRERASDLKDISRRLIRNLIGVTAAGTAFLEDPRVLVSEDLTPSDTASLDRSKILAIATETGGQTSHAVIMARASGVPAVVGVRSLIEGLNEGDTLLVDGFEGLVIINPSETTLFRYGKVGIRRKKLKDLVEEDAKEPALTKDGQPFQLYANADTPEEVKAALDSAVRELGSFRTEALFLLKMRCHQKMFNFLIIVN